MIIVSVASSILMFCIVSVSYRIISNLRCPFFSHFSKLKIRACHKVKVVFFAF